MRLIGLTGGIATGKSTVAKLLAAHGAVIVDADALAREVVLPGTPALAEIAAEFGPDALHADGTLNRAALGAIVFADEARRTALEAITHPRIRSLMAQHLSAALAHDDRLIVADIPLLYERGYDRTFWRKADTPLEGVMLVDCPDEVQLSRLMARDGIDATDAQRRIGAQLPMDEKRSRATWIIDNSGSDEATAAQVDQWWRTVAQAVTAG